MVNHREGVVLAENTSGVSVKLGSSVNTTRNGATSIDLRHHLVLTGNTTIVTNSVLLVVLNGRAVSVRGAGSTLVHSGTLLVLSLVVVTSLVGDTVLMSISVHGDIVTSLARTSVGTVNNVLNREESRRPSTSTEHVDTVGEGRGGSMGPTRTTILRDMLVTSSGSKVGSVDRTPIPSGREIFRLHVSMGTRGSDHLTSLTVAESHVADNAAGIDRGLGVSLSRNAKEKSESDGSEENVLHCDFERGVL